MDRPNRSSSPEPLSREEERMLLETLEAGETLRCPRSGIRLTCQEIEPRADISYVRHRIVIVCGGCGVHGALDLPPPAPGPAYREP